MTFRGIALAGGLLWLAGCDRAPSPPAPPAPAAAASPAPTTAASGSRERPTLAVTTLDGRPWRLSEHRGQWVVVNFWATWCAPCLAEMPELSALDAMREHIAVIGLAYEDTTPQALTAFMARYPVVYPIAIVDMGAPPVDFDAPQGLPTTDLIAPDGRFVRRFVGPVTAAALEQAIAEAGGPPPGR